MGNVGQVTLGGDKIRTALLCTGRYRPRRNYAFTFWMIKVHVKIAQDKSVKIRMMMPGTIVKLFTIHEHFSW